MNVALTRAKSSLFILGNSPTLERSDTNWSMIVNDARKRSCLVDVSQSSFCVTSTKFTLIQVDQTYFTRSSSAPGPKSGPSKAAKSTVEMIPTPLPVLFRPQDSKPNKTKSQVRPSTNEAPTNGSKDVSQPKSHTTGMKRIAEYPSDKRDGKRHMQHPTKRAKKEPNIFIPKSKKP